MDFVGRRRALGELVHWLEHQPADGSIRVVTGGPGSGKSALLAQLVEPGGPRARAHVDGVWATVRATGLDVAQVTRGIARALSSPTEDPDTLIRVARDQHRPLIVVVDALDEAVTSTEAWSLATGLLVPLAQVRRAKVLVGARRGPEGAFLRALGHRPTVINLDYPPYFQLDDLIKYTARSLRLDVDPSAPSPYRDDPATTAQVARAIAEAAEPSFLVAGLTARAYAHGAQVVDTSAPGWQQRQVFPVDADMAIADYLDRLTDPKRAFDLLVPVAYARHPGLPCGALWALLAQAASGNPYNPADIDWLRATPASYLLEEDGLENAAEGAGRVVRPFHHTLVEHIRSRTQPSMVERTITSVLRQRAEAAGGWLHAEPYARAHTASHAAQAGGGLLDRLVTDPAFLLAADRRTLVRALPTLIQPHARRAGRCYRAGAHRLAGDTAAGAAYLELASKSAGCRTLADRVRQLGQPQPFMTQLARHRPATDLLALRGHTGQIYAVAWGRIHGALVLASAGTDAVIRLWDPIHGSQLRALHGHADEVHALAWGTFGGAPLSASDAPLLASASADATIRLWDPVDGSQLRALRGHADEVHAVAWGWIHGAPVLASAGTDASVRLWDPVDGTQLRALRGHADEVHAVAWGWIHGAPVLASASADATIRLWDPVDGTQLRAIHGHSRRVWSVAWGILDSAPVLASASADATIRLWSPADGAQICALQGHSGQMYAVAWGMMHSAPVLASAGDSRTVRVWDPVEGTELCALQGHSGWVWTADWSMLGETPVLAYGGDDHAVRVWGPAESPHPQHGVHGHTDEVLTVAWGWLHGAPVLASASADATIRLWDPASGAQLRALHGHSRGVWSVAWGTLGSAPVLASAGANDTIRLWDPASGVQLRDLHGHTDEIYAVTWGWLHGAPVLASASADATIRLWDPVDGAQLRALRCRYTDGVWALAWAASGAPVLASAGADAGADGHVRLWDLAGGTQLRTLRGHTGPVSAVAFGALDGAPLLASAGRDGTVRLWDLAHQRQAVLHFDGPVHAVAIGPHDQLALAGWSGVTVLLLHPTVFTNPQTARPGARAAR